MYTYINYQFEEINYELEINSKNKFENGKNEQKSQVKIEQN